MRYIKLTPTAKLLIILSSALMQWAYLALWLQTREPFLWLMIISVAFSSLLFSPWVGFIVWRLLRGALGGQRLLWGMAGAGFFAGAMLLPALLAYRSIPRLFVTIQNQTAKPVTIERLSSQHGNTSPGTSIPPGAQARLTLKPGDEIEDYEITYSLQGEPPRTQPVPTYVTNGLPQVRSSLTIQPDGSVMHHAK